MKSEKLKQLLELNLAIFLISSAAVLVRYIDLHPIVIAFWRGIIAFILLGSMVLLKKQSFKISDAKDRRRLFFSSFLLALHWILYFYALQISNIAVGILSLFTYPAITAILEPIYFKTKFVKRHLILAVVVLIGLYIMSPEIDFSNNTTKGIIAGVLSALVYALRNLSMKSNIKKYNGNTIMFYQFLWVAILFTPFLFTLETEGTLHYFPYILLLGVFTTAVGHTLFAKSFGNFDISTASIISSSQPVFGILLGVLFLHEIPNLQTIIGGAVIVSTVVIESYSTQKKKG